MALSMSQDNSMKHHAISFSKSSTGKPSQRLLSYCSSSSPTTPRTSHSRKRSLRSRMQLGTFGLASAAVGVVVLLGTLTTGFQCGLLPPSRSSVCGLATRTALGVLVDPMRLAPKKDTSSVQRKKRAVTDRATLEDLYMLSALQELDADGRLDEDVFPSRRVPPNDTGRLKGNTRKTSLNAAAQPAASSSTKTKPVRGGGRTKMMRSTKQSAAISMANESGNLPQKPPVTSTVNKFKGLTVNPKRKNRRRNSLSTVPPTERNRDLYSIPESSHEMNPKEVLRLMKDEEGLLEVTATEMLDEKENSLPVMPAESTVVQTFSTSVRSSTMPGFGQKVTTDRRRAYDAGIKLAEERSGQKFIESSEAKVKRQETGGALMYRTTASVPESLMRFAYEIHDIQRITPKEEKELGTKTQEAIKLQNIFDGLERKLAREPTDEEWCAASGKINMEAISQVIEEGLEAKNKLVLSNLRMVQGVVNVYIRNGLEANYNAGDLMQEGIMALIRAAEKFDPTRGFRFSTYAMYWIRSAIKRDQIYQSRVVQVPQRIYENHKRLVRIQSDLKGTLNRPPTKNELCDATGFSLLEIDRIIEAMKQQNLSFDQRLVNHRTPTKDDGAKDTLHSIIASKVDESEYDSVVHTHLREDLINALHEHLTEEEAFVLMLRFGIVDGKTPSRPTNGVRSYAEVSRMAGLKPDKVRRLIYQSLQQLQTVMGDEWKEYEMELQQ